MAVTAKICGVSTPEAVDAALAGGASHLGFVFFPRSPRQIDLPAARGLAGRARGRAKIVALLVEPDDALADGVAAELEPDFLQLHGHEAPERVAAIAQRTGKPIIKALPVSTAADLERARAYEPVVEHLMFDARPAPGADRPGGLGETIDWDLLKGRSFAKPWFLAGGLTPQNVAEAVRRSEAPLVDVSSGVERGPGLKDPALITAFLDAVRRV